MNPDWLPDLVLSNDYQGNWPTYIEALYAFFRADFIDTKPVFQGQRLGLKRHPVIDGKEATFWHFISEGEIEADRLPAPRRCERIRWPKVVIEGNNPDIKIWKNKRNGETRINLLVESVGYLVILADRKGYLLPWTAYPIERNHEVRKKLRDYEQYRKNPW